MYRWKNRYTKLHWIPENFGKIEEILTEHSILIGKETTSTGTVIYLQRDGVHYETAIEGDYIFLDEKESDFVVLGNYEDYMEEVKE